MEKNKFNAAGERSLIYYHVARANNVVQFDQYTLYIYKDIIIIVSLLGDVTLSYHDQFPPLFFVKK